MLSLFLMRGLIPLLVSTLFFPPTVRADASHRADGAFQPPGYEIGSVGSRDCVLGKFILRNTGDQRVVLRSVRRNCACYRIFPTVNRLRPGESTILAFELSFPKGKRLRNAIFYILSNDRQKPLRLFVVKLTQSDDPNFAASKPDQIVLHMLDEALADEASIEALNREHGAVGLQELASPDNKRRYALEFPRGTDIAKVARAYLEHPSVGLVLFRASDGERVAGESIERPTQVPPAPPRLQAKAWKRPLRPLAIHWFYSEGCAFCDEVKKLLKQISEQYGKTVVVQRHEISILENYEKSRPCSFGVMRIFDPRPATS